MKQNTRAVHPQWPGWRVMFAGYKTFVCFALTYIERLLTVQNRREIRWSVSGAADLRSALEGNRGVLLFTAHFGNFDIAATYFSQHFPRTLHIVRAIERTEGLQQIRAEELNGLELRYPRLKVHYAKSQWDLGLKVYELLSAGQVVGVQGDRPIPGEAPIVVEEGGVSFLLPRGPLILAQLCGARCFPVFTTRLGASHYLLESAPEFHDGRSKATIEEIGKQWLRILVPFIRKNVSQWFVFETVVRRG